MFCMHMVERQNAFHTAPATLKILSMVNGTEATTLVMVRLSEMMHISLKPTLKELVDIQEIGSPALPSDFYMDCRDLFELCAGQKVLPQDKAQRLYVLGICEGRIAGRIRQNFDSNRIDDS